MFTTARRPERRGGSVAPFVPRLAVSLLLAVLFLGLFATVSRGDDDFGGNLDTSIGSGIQVYSGKALAQSFTFAKSVGLTRVSLYLSDVGVDDSVVVAIHRDSVGSPAAAAVASIAVNAGPGFRWVDAVFASPVVLDSAASYWIVLTDALGSGNGYEWWSSGYDANASGRAAESSGSWVPRTDDFAFRLFGLREIRIELNLSSFSDVAIPGGSIDLELGLAVDASEPVRTAWLNVSFPSAVMYASDNFSASGLAFTRQVMSWGIEYAFADVPAGFHPVELDLLVSPTAANGSSVLVAGAIEFPSLTGPIVRTTSPTALFRVLDVNATAAASVAEDWAIPGGPLHYRANLTVGSSNLALTDVRAEIRLSNGTFTWASPGASYTPSWARWSPGWLADNTTMDFLADATMDLGLEPGGAASARVLITFALNGTTLRLLDVPLATRSSVPRIVVSLTPETAIVREGEFVTFQIDIRNEGTGIAGDIWINTTLDNRLRFEGDVRPGGERYVLGQLVAWRFPSLQIGSVRIEMNVSIHDLAEDGAMIPTLVSVQYNDGLGHRLAPTYSNVAELDAAAPSFLATVGAPVSQATDGELLTQRIAIQNRGRDASKNVTVIENVGPNLRFVSSDAPSPPSLSSSSIVWRFRDFGPGTSLVFDTRFQAVNGGATEAVVGLSIAVQYSDRDGTTSSIVNSNVYILRVVPSTTFLLLTNPFFVLFISVVGVGAGVAGLQYYVGSQAVDEVFLVRKDGILVAHRLRASALSRDPDLFSAMFTAIQDFVRESFRASERRPLRSLSFGDLHATIVTGPVAYVAVIYRGKAGRRFGSKLAEIMNQIETAHGSFIAKWDGDQTSIGPILPLVDSVIRIRGLRFRTARKSVAGANEAAGMLSGPHDSNPPTP